MTSAQRVRYQHMLDGTPLAQVPTVEDIRLLFTALTRLEDRVSQLDLALNAAVCTASGVIFEELVMHKKPIRMRGE